MFQLRTRLSSPRTLARTARRSFSSGLSLALGLTLGLSAALGLSACKNKGKETCNPDDYAYEELALHIQASADLNLDSEGNPLPTVVRLYQLNGDLALRSLDSVELWEDHETALGDEYISDKEIQIFPDSAETIKLAPESGAKFVLVAGGFQNPVGNTWYRVYEVPNSYGQQACDMKKEDEDPATLGEPCIYLYLERNQIDGGKNVPPGFDDEQVEGVCTPLYTKKTVATEEDEEEGKDKKKK